MIRIEEKKRHLEASFLDDLLKDAGKSLLGGVSSRLQDVAHDVLRWSLRQMVCIVVAAALIITAAILLLIAGVKGLQEASVPPSVAHLLAGVVGLTAGLVLYKVKN